VEHDFPYRAKDLIRQRRYQDAVRLCRGELLADPDNIEGKVVLAMAHLALQQYEQVCQLVSPVVADQPSMAPARRLLGEALLRLGETTRAREHLEAARDAAPDDPGISDLLSELEGRPRGSTARPAAHDDAIVAIKGIQRLTPLTFAEDDEEFTATGAEQAPMVLARGHDEFLLEPDDDLLDLSAPTKTSSAAPMGSRPSPAHPPAPPRGDQMQAPVPSSVEVVIDELEELIESERNADDDATMVGDVPDREALSAGLDLLAGSSESRPLPVSVHDSPTGSIDLTSAEIIEDITLGGDGGPLDQETEKPLMSFELEAPDLVGGGGEADEVAPVLTRKKSSIPPLPFDALAEDRTVATVMPEYRGDMDPSAPMSFPQAYSGPIPMGRSDLLRAAEDVGFVGFDETVPSEVTTADGAGVALVEEIDEAPTAAMEMPESMPATAAELLAHDLDEAPTGAIELPPEEPEPAPPPEPMPATAAELLAHDLDEAPTGAMELPPDGAGAVAPGPLAGPPDPDATRVLDTASAAIIRAQAGAPLRSEQLRVKKVVRPTEELEDFTDDKRDLEGTDSFSPLADATLVDEGSLLTLREHLRTHGKGEEGRKKKTTLPLPSGVHPVSAAPPATPPPAASGAQDRPTSSRPPPLPVGADKQGRGSWPERLPPVPRFDHLVKEEAPTSEDGLARKHKRTLTGITSGRDPGISTKVLNDAAAAQHDDEEKTANEIPGGAQRLLDKIRTRSGEPAPGSGPRDHPGSSRPPPLPPPLPPSASSRPPPPLRGDGRGSIAPTAGEVPALKSSDVVMDQQKTAPQRGEEPTPPLDQPFLPGEFPKSPSGITDPDTAIPLSTGDLIVSSVSQGAGEDPRTRGREPAPRPRARVTHPHASAGDPLDQPLRPEDFSSHRIPLPELLLGSDGFSLERPLTPSNFNRKRAGGVRQLPPVSVLDQPISPEDFTPGPLVKRKERDILEDPFWPEDFIEGVAGGYGDRSFQFGRPEAPRPPPVPPRPEPAAADPDLVDTRAFLSPPEAKQPFTSSPPPTMGVPPVFSPPPPTIGVSPAFSPPPPGPWGAQQPVVEPREPPPPARPGPTMRPEPVVEPSKGPDRKADRAGQRKKQPPGKAAPKRPRRSGLLVGVGVVAIVFVVGVAFGVITLFEARRLGRLKLMASDAIAHGNYRNYIEAVQIYDGILADHEDDEELLAEAARIRAVIALEFGTADDEQAEALIQRAATAGATEPQLAPARAAVDLYRGNLGDADQILTAVQSSTGENACELIYLRGLWYLRQESNREALRRFVAAAEADPEGRDIRMLLAQALAYYAQGVHQAALQKLDEVEQIAPRNVSSRLLRAKIDIETGRDPRAGEVLAQEVLDDLSSEASPGQLGWAKLLEVRYLVQSEKHLEAREVIKGALESRPTRDAEFSALAARTLLDLSDAASAREEAKRAVELAPHLHRYRLLLAEALVEESDLTTAEIHLRPVGNSPKASLLQGRIRLARGDLDGAAQRFEEATQGEREAPQAKLFLAEIHLKQGRTQQAIDLLERLATGPPALPQARVMLGEAYLRTNQLAEAQAALEQAQVDLPGNCKVSVALGKLYARQGDQVRAIQAVQDALAIEPANMDALVALGELQLKAGNTSQAAEAFDRALKVRPEHTEALVGRARAATSMREFEAAERYLDQASKQAPPGVVELARGELRLRQYQPAEAVALLQKAVEAQPHDSLVRALLGDACVMRGEPSTLKRARTEYQEALKQRPDLPEALVGLAEISMSKRDIDVAGEAVEKTAVSPNIQARVNNLRGRYSWEMDGDSAAALEALERALELDDNLAEAHLSIGIVLENSGRNRDACRHFQRYLDLAENGPEADVTESRRGIRDNCQ
jgi:tetratricopeptide (TPR) repeat protein